MQFTGGATASLSMIGFTESICAREVNVFGTKVRVGSFIFLESTNIQAVEINFLIGWDQI